MVVTTGRDGSGQGGELGSPRCVGIRSVDVVWDQRKGQRQPQVYRAVSIAGYGFWAISGPALGDLCYREDSLLDSAQMSMREGVGVGRKLREAWEEVLQ